jgi:hypothetical protein
MHLFEAVMLGIFEVFNVMEAPVSANDSSDGEKKDVGA